MPEYKPLQSDTVEVAEVARTLRRGWRAVIGFLVLGVVAAGAVVLFAPARYTGKSSVLVRSSATEGGASILSKLTGVGGFTGGADLGLGSQIETEIQVLKSRTLSGRVVDSLLLQFRVGSPEGVPPTALVSAAALRESFAPRSYSFTRTREGRYAVDGSSLTHEAQPGRPVMLEVGSVTLATQNLPGSFAVKVYDREDAITRFQRRLTVKKAGGDVAGISYSADDKPTAAAAPNALVAVYLEQRKTVDRGTNERRVEFLARELDSVGTELNSTERALRRQQEASGVLDAEIVGKVELEGSSQLRRALVDIEVEEGAINQLLSQLDAGQVKPRQLAAHPAFLRGSSLTPLIAQLSELEAQRVRLLERRTENDPEVIALEQSIKTVEASFVSTARSYATTLTRQRVDMRRQIDSVHRTLVALPAAAESGGRLQRDVLRLSQIYGAVQAQLVQAKLAAIGEGGFVRQLDVAVSPRRPTFPEPWLTMGIGTTGGLIAGMIAALILGWFGRWLRDPLEIERATGVLTQRLAGDSPLLMAGSTVPRTLLVIPIDDQARAGLVAERLVRTATHRAISATLLDLSRSVSGNGNGSQPLAVAQAIAQLEQQYGMVVVQLPSLSNDATVAALTESRPVLLVAPPGRVNRARLESAVETLRRLQVPCAGVVISESVSPGTALL